MCGWRAVARPRACRPRNAAKRLDCVTLECPTLACTSQCHVQCHCQDSFWCGLVSFSHSKALYHNHRQAPACNPSQVVLGSHSSMPAKAFARYASPLTGLQAGADQRLKICSSKELTWGYQCMTLSGSQPGML